MAYPGPLEFDGSEPRFGVEDAVEDYLVAMLETLLVPTPGLDDLKKVLPFLPNWFGGLFPTAGVDVYRTSGGGRGKDRPNLPGTLHVQVNLYDVALPMRGPQRGGDDRSGLAKRRVRRLRNRFIDRLYASGLKANVFDLDSRAGSRDELGIAYLTEDERDLLWIDRTEFEVRL